MIFFLEDKNVICLNNLDNLNLDKPIIMPLQWSSYSKTNKHAPNISHKYRLTRPPNQQITPLSLLGKPVCTVLLSSTKRLFNLEIGSG